MCPNKRRHLPGFDRCEGRLTPSGGAAANTLGVVSGDVTSPRSIADVSVPVTQHNIGGRRSAIISELVTPGSQSALHPAVTGAQGTNGQALLFRRGAPYIAGRHESAAVYVKANTAGALTTGVTGRNNSTGSFQVGATLPGDINGDGKVTLADEVAFTQAFMSTKNDPNYNPAADANHNGQVGIGDAKLLLRNLTPLTPKIPLNIYLTLAPQDAAKGPTPKNSGGKTHFQNVTILGRTTPGAMVFLDGKQGTFQFNGAALATDAEGNFAVNVKLSKGLNSYQFEAIDPFGQQKIMVYPIYWLNYAAAGSTLD